METNNSFNDIFVKYQPIEISDPYDTYSSDGIYESFPLIDDNPIKFDWAVSENNGNIIVRNNLPVKSNLNYSKTTDNKEKEFKNVPTTDENSTELSFKELIEQEHIPARISSGYRKNGRTAQGRESNHSKLDKYGNSMAYDIVPLPGYSFDDLRQALYKNPRIINWFKQRNWGVLEEMQDGRRGFYDLSGKFHYTKATGPHFHIGPDYYGVENYNSKIQLAKEGMKFKDTNFVVYKPIEDDEIYEPKIELPLLGTVDISSWADRMSQDGTTPIVRNNISNDNLFRMTGFNDERSEETSYSGNIAPSGNNEYTITEDQLGKDKDTGDSYILNPSSLVGDHTILNSSASRKGNNPLSISPSKSDVGSAGSFRVKDGQNFGSYNSVVDGLASAMRLYKRKYNNRSVRGINDGYQGYYELTKNNKNLTKLRLIWITNISKYLGINPTIRLNLDDKETMFSLMAAIAKQESSSTLGRDDLEAAWKKAFG